QRLILDDVLDRLHRDGELSHFAAVADSRGFADALFGFLTELKGQGVSPAAFARTAFQIATADGRGTRRSGVARELRPKDRDIARAFARYQQRLRRHRLLDREATYARAREVLTAGRAGWFAAVRAVFVDGFADFPPP